MATSIQPFGAFSGLAPMIQEDLKKLKDAWLWFLILGGALIFFGVDGAGLLHVLHHRQRGGPRNLPDRWGCLVHRRRILYR